LSTGHWLRPYLTAFFVATLAALVIDAALQLAMDTVRVSTYGRAPWWITANLVERGRWVAFALLLWRIAPLIIEPVGATVAPWTAGRSDAWRRVGVAVVVVPLLWVCATWIVSAVRFTLLGTWDTDGRVFLSADYYSRLLVDLAPWLLSGAAVVVASRHVD
jgi:hypothetical protein